MRRPLLCLLAPALLAAVAHSLVVAAEDVPAAPAAASAPGRAIYEAACASCHGQRGDGKGPVAAYFDPPPRDFTSGVYKFRTTASGQLPLPADLARTISEGIPGTGMPAWRDTLSEADIAAVAAHLQTFSPRFAAARRAPRVVPGPVEAAPGQPAVAEGRMLYLALQCWQCHGARGHGDGPSVATLVDDWGRPSRPTDFRGTLRSGRARDDVFRTLSTGLAGTPMPAFRDAVVVGREAFGDLTALAGVADAATLAQVQAWVATQPAQAELDALAEEEQRARGDRRLWALVDYVRAQHRAVGLLGSLFGSTTGRLPANE